MSSPSPEKIEKRLLKAIRASGLVDEREVERALAVQRHAAAQGRVLPIDRVFLRLGLLDREQILGLYRALRYYLWRREDKFYCKLAVQSKFMSPEAAKACLREQKQAYRHEDQLVRVNEIARQRGYVKAGEDRAIVAAMYDVRPATLRPVDDERAGQDAARPSPGAAREGEEAGWRRDAQRKDLEALRAHLANTVSSDEGRGVSDPDLDALWDEADADDVELDSQIVEIARPLLALEDSGEDDLD